MTKRSTDLSSLVSSGRVGKGVPTSREEVLAALLRKRAAAWRGGLADLEAKLRNQILGITRAQALRTEQIMMGATPVQ